ncbi:MAG: hypothetical protein AAF810_03100 [Cyanobacteria bacterium P01_D01_bin.36]
MPYRRPQTQLRHIWLRSAIIVFFIMMMRILQQQAEGEGVEFFNTLMLRRDSGFGLLR